MIDFVFSDKLAEAQQAEEYAREFLSEQRGVVRVIDVRKDAAWQRRDIDFRAVMKNGVLNVEAKADRHISRTSNILFELCHINYEQPPERRTRPGWSVYSTAHLFLVSIRKPGWGLKGMMYHAEIGVAKQPNQRIHHGQQSYNETEKCRLLSHSACFVALHSALAAKAETPSARRQTTRG